MLSAVGLFEHDEGILKGEYLLVVVVLPLPVFDISWMTLSHDFGPSAPSLWLHRG